jgi:hypothetical protein
VAFGLGGRRGASGASTYGAHISDEHGSHSYIFHGKHLFKKYDAFILSPLQAITYALFDLTTYPEYLLPMREEAERVVKEEGWTKAALNSMVKIDSFLRESQRINAGPGAFISGFSLCVDA